MVAPVGIEPTSTAPETVVLSIELRGHHKQMKTNKKQARTKSTQKPRRKEQISFR